jgi:hypothetical protein
MADAEQPDDAASDAPQSAVRNPFAPGEDVPKEALIRGKRSAAFWGIGVGLFFALMLVAVIVLGSYAFGS